MTDLQTDSVEAVRRFNRLYTKRIGVLRDPFLKTQFSLTEARVLYELAHREGATASEIGRELDLDPGYLSRILRSFEGRGLLAKTRSATDGRQSLLGLTEAGKVAFALVDSRSREEVGALLDSVPENGRDRVVAAMREIEALIGDHEKPRIPYVLRPHRSGDMGWVVHRHGVLYAKEYGFDERFEAMVAEIVAEFIRNFDPRREHCWIAERDGEIVGSVFIVHESDTVAKLRLLLVEPSARGLGIGRRLVEECIRFARGAGYREMTLWTHSILTSARQIYEQAGFRRVSSEPHAKWGPDVVGETWVLTL